VAERRGHSSQEPEGEHDEAGYQQGEGEVEGMSEHGRENIVVSAGISLIASANLLRSQATGCDLYGFSCENWKRPAAEIDDLMGLLWSSEFYAWRAV